MLAFRGRFHGAMFYAASAFALTPLAVFCLTLMTLVSRAGADSIGISVTPHASYSSSIGVLGCKINTDRVAYWPMAVGCTDICVKLSYGSRSVHLLRIDHSGGAYDVSYDAWNYLQTGKSATKDPIAGGGVAMTYENVSASECSSLIKSGGQLAMSASNSMNYLFSCLADDTSWVAQNYVLYNIADPLCSVGYNEKCDLDLSTGANQATCPHTLGSPTLLTSQPVYNIMYPSGEKVLATTGEAASGVTAVSLSMRRVFGAFASVILLMLPHV